MSNNIKQLLKQLLVLFCLYSLLRIVFLFSNYTYFSQSSISDLLLSLISGLRFDASAIAFTNGLVIILLIIPTKLYQTNWYQAIVRVLFLTINIPFIILNCADIVYFRFTLKRATSDAFKLALVGDDFKNSLPLFIKDYWHIVLVGLVIIVLFGRFYKLTITRSNYLVIKENRIAKYITIVLITFLTILAARGGFQLRPLSIINASESSAPANAPLVLNTTFTLIKSYGKNELINSKYFDDKTRHELFNPIHIKLDKDSFQKKNVVIIILESFSKEYVSGMNPYEGYTPFLDSLIRESLVFTNGFANGKKSIEAIPAILAGIPALMDEPLITSIYSGNKYCGIAEVLKKEGGYNTSFFHGGTNGTMGFEAFTKSIGFENYYGRKEYNNEKDYDGHWGIFDEPFFQYFAKTINVDKEPFLSCIFSISSHHPYTVPEKYTSIFKKGNLPIHQSIRYTDYSLRRFFETSSKMPWFDNTLFIITADHTFDSEFASYQTPVGKYRVPIIIYQHNSSLKGKNDYAVQHIDILPTILDYLHYNKPYFAMGTSMLDSGCEHFSINFLNGIYQLISKDYSLQFDGNKTISLNDYKTDTLMKVNLMSSKTTLKDSLERKLKAMIQEYNQDMISNKFYLPVH
ncbi:MAG: sulfatase-like hydrolase/transferase [Bacteroidota bacterium]